MMWWIMQIYMGFTLLTIYVHGYKEEILNAISRDELFEGIFMPDSQNPIGNGSLAEIYKGMNMYNKKEVAMKFSKHINDSKNEYKFYSYLKAIDDGTNKINVEKFGISPIYYYEIFDTYTLTAISLFECDLWEKKVTSMTIFEDIDALILFRDFVRQSNYIHSCGIRHDDVSPYNIMLRKGRSFLVDFDGSKKMHEPFGIHNIRYASRRFHREKNLKREEKSPGFPMDDWESFLYTMAHILDVHLPWFRVPIEEDEKKSKLQYEKIKKQKDDTDETIRQIKIRFERGNRFFYFKQVIYEFAEDVFKKDARFPRYIYFDELITKKMNELMKQPEQAVFSWLKDGEIEIAKKDLKKIKPATAKDIGVPKPVFVAGDYVEPNYEHFIEQKEKMTKMAEKNHQIYRAKEKLKSCIKNFVSPCNQS